MRVRALIPTTVPVAVISFDIVIQEITLYLVNEFDPQLVLQRNHSGVYFIIDSLSYSW